MAYIPTEWETGDVITAAKLNNMEHGIEDAFVAPEVAAVDQGKVLTVDSSGDWDAAYPEKEVARISVDMVVDTSTFAPRGIWHATGDIDDIMTAKACVLQVTLYAEADSTFSTPLAKYELYRRELPLTSSGNVVFDGVLLLADTPSVLIAYGQVNYHQQSNEWSHSPFRFLSVQS